MTTDLGLHLRIDVDPTYLDEEIDTDCMNTVRRSLFWVVYCADT